MKDCDLLGGDCYYDGSSLNADPVLEVLIEKGIEGVYEYLIQYYEDTFGEKP
jgi:hypothetical protein